jgi:hypothetical protein
MCRRVALPHLRDGILSGRPGSDSIRFDVTDAQVVVGETVNDSWTGQVSTKV